MQINIRHTQAKTRRRRTRDGDLVRRRRLVWTVWQSHAENRAKVLPKGGQEGACSAGFGTSWPPNSSCERLDERLGSQGRLPDLGLQIDL